MVLACPCEVSPRRLRCGEKNGLGSLVHGGMAGDRVEEKLGVKVEETLEIQCSFSFVELFFFTLVVLV